MNIFHIEITQEKIQDAQIYFYEELKKIVESFDVNNMITNGNIATVIQDSIHYTLNPNATKVPNLVIDQTIYLLGEFLNLKLYVDTMMRWDDCTIYLKKDDDTICKVIIYDEAMMLM